MRSEYADLLKSHEQAIVKTKMQHWLGFYDLAFTHDDHFERGILGIVSCTFHVVTAHYLTSLIRLGVILGAYYIVQELMFTANNTSLCILYLSLSRRSFQH